MSSYDPKRTHASSYLLRNKPERATKGRLELLPLGGCCPRLVLLQFYHQGGHARLSIFSGSHSSLSGWPEQAGANFLILSLSFLMPSDFATGRLRGLSPFLFAAPSVELNLRSRKTMALPKRGRQSMFSSTSKHTSIGTRCSD